MAKRFLSAILALSLVLSLVACGSIMASEKKIMLKKTDVGNTGAVISAELSGMSRKAEITAQSSDESIAKVSVKNNTITVTGCEGAVGVAAITVTATDSDGERISSVAEVPVGYTTFVFNGGSVTVIEGSDTKYEVVGQNPADEAEHALEISTDAAGNTVYTDTADAKLCISIKKSGGAYVFSGNGTDGAIAVKKEATGNAFLLLNGLNLTSSYTSPITVKKNSNAAVVITALAGTVNTLSDAAFNNADTYGPTEDGGDGTNQFYAESAVIKAKTGATVYLNGSGTLNINGNAKNGIKTGADSLLEIDEQNLVVNAAYNGIASENELFIRGGRLNVSTAGNDAIKADDDTSTVGNLTVTGGEITINSADEGLIAAANINIYGGTFDITGAGDAVKAENIDETAGDIYVCGGDFTIVSTCDGFQAAGNMTVRGGTFDITCCGGHSNSSYNKDTDPSAKGMKAGGALNFRGGNITIDSADDALHSNNSLTITGGTFNLSSGDDGVHADYNLILGERGGDDADINLTVANSYEGLEGAAIVGNSGRYFINASDDGINAANGDLTGYSFSMRFYGGEFHVYGRSGDGVDSNGELSVYGGMLEIFCPGGGNGALDADGTLGTFGGTTVAVGKAEMPQIPSQGIYVVFGGSGGGWGGGPGGGGGGLSSSFYDGDTIAVKNSAGTVLYEGTVRYYNSNSYSNHVVFSDPALVSGQSYTLYRNGSSIATATATGSGSAAPAEETNWQSVGQPGSIYTRVQTMPVGIGSVITNTQSNYALSGGAAISGTPVSVSTVTGGYSIDGVAAGSTWYRDANGKLYCTVNGVNYYLAYTASGYGWNTTYSIALSEDAASAPVWNVAANGGYASISTSVSGGGGWGGGPGGPGGPGGGRTLYLAANGSSFTLSSNASSVYIYSPDCAQAVLEGETDYFINLDNGESITEEQILNNTSVRFRSGVNAQAQTLSWTDSRITAVWNPAFNGNAAGEYVLTVSVLGTQIGTIRVTIISPNAGSGAPTPEQPNPPQVLLGDTDGDGSITVSDALLAMRAAIGAINLDAAAALRADMDGNGSVSAADALAILRLALGL